ncbi:MAG: galactokinase [Clostridia bacterium]|nr:galactokinase [Clostridia bacterium]
MDITSLKNTFCSLFGEGGELFAYASPGRVNLIGEHTDYNGGVVLPAAITLGTTIIARKRSDNKICLRATDLPDYVEADLSCLSAYKNIPWGNYQLGVADILLKDGVPVSGCDLLFHDTTPHGGGLSSSAGIEVATALCLYHMATGKMPDMREIAKVGQRAEIEYVGVNCGIMDQFASAMGKENHAIFLCCKDLSYEAVPLFLGEYRIVITNTNKKRSLITSKYNERRGECEKALGDLQTAMPSLSCLGDLSPEEFEKNVHLIKDATCARRARHVVEECARVKESVNVLKSGDLASFGKLMNDSHDSLRDLYEVTGEELDTLVNAARMESGCIGSRMTGAGFGGCTVSLVKGDSVDAFTENVSRIYTEKIGYAPSFYITSAGDGGRIL